jgi:YcxB-like protein
VDGLIPQDTVEFDATLRAQDYAALSIQLAGRPDQKRRRYVQVALYISMMPVGALAFAAYFWMSDPQRVPFGDAIRFLPKFFWDDFLVPWLLMCAVAAVLLLGHQRRVLASVTRLAGGTNELFESNHFRVDHGGFRIERPNVRQVFDWPEIKCLEETNSHLFLRIHTFLAIVIPKRDVNGETLDALKKQINAHVPHAPVN